MKWGYKHCFVNCFTRFGLWWYNEVKHANAPNFLYIWKKKLTHPYTPYSGAIKPIPNKLCERIVWWGQRKEIEPQSSRKDYRGWDHRPLLLPRVWTGRDGGWTALATAAPHRLRVTRALVLLAFLWRLEERVDAFLPVWSRPWTRRVPARIFSWFTCRRSFTYH